MALLDSIPHRQKAADQRPWPRVIVGDDGWLAAIEHLTSGHATLLGFWGEPAAVHMALLGADFSEIAVDGFKSLAEGQKVEFEIGSGPKGPRALKVRPQ